MLEIDPTTYISPHADLESSVRGTRIIIGAGCQIDSFVKIKTAGGLGDLVIGKNVYLNSGTVVYTGNGIVIGDDALIAANCTLAATNHAFEDPNNLIRLQGFQPCRGGIVIGRDAWLGAGSIVLDGAVIGDGCIVAAGSIVRGELESYWVYAGNPLSKVRKRGG